MLTILCVHGSFNILLDNQIHELATYCMFNPSQLNEDLDGEIQFQSSTGPFFVPIKCRTKKCEVRTTVCLIFLQVILVSHTHKNVI